jgi:hypothetical protein
VHHNRASCISLSYEWCQMSATGMLIVINMLELNFDFLYEKIFNFSLITTITKQQNFK